MTSRRSPRRWEPPVFVDHCEDGRWYATFETAEPHSGPESNVAAILDAIDALPEAHRATLAACSRRELSVGHRLAAGGGEVAGRLPPTLLRRVADAGLTLERVAYPPAG